VLRAIGVPESELDALLLMLYREVTLLYNNARLVEIQAMENRKTIEEGSPGWPA